MQKRISVTGIQSILLVFSFTLVLTRLIADPSYFVLFLVTVFLLFSLSVYKLIKLYRGLENRTLSQAPLNLLILITVMLSVVYRESSLGINLFFVPSKSMQPSILPGDIILVDTRAFEKKQPIEGNVVVFYHRSFRQTMVKRVIRSDAYSTDFEGDDKKESINRQLLKNTPNKALRGKATGVIMNTYEKTIKLTKL